MPKLLRDFRCDCCGAVQERYVDTEFDRLPCMHCDGTAKREIGMPRVALDGTDPGFPGAYDRWATIREKNAAEKRKKSYATD